MSTVDPRRLLVFGAVIVALSACATPKTDTSPTPRETPAPSFFRPKPPPPAPAAVATAGLSAKQRLKLALDLLSKGDPIHAKPEIEAFLLEQPDNELGKSLLAQIVEDPHVLLGAQSFPYKIQPGETLSILADRYLDDRFKFYALARYNGIVTPSQSEVGQVIQIPGVPRKVAESKPKPASIKSDDELLQQRLDAKRAPARPAAPARDPARASELRGRALELLNRGVVDRAVATFRQALALDPGNAVIQRDLDRALRILASVRSNR